MGRFPDKIEFITGESDCELNRQIPSRKYVDIECAGDVNNYMDEAHEYMHQAADRITYLDGVVQHLTDILDDLVCSAYDPRVYSEEVRDALVEILKYNKVIKTVDKVAAEGRSWRGGFTPFNEKMVKAVGKLDVAYDGSHYTPCHINGRDITNIKGLATNLEGLGRNEKIAPLVKDIYNPTNEDIDMVRFEFGDKHVYVNILERQQVLVKRNKGVL